MTRNHLNNGHEKTIGTDFDQFCAACELIFSKPIKCCSRIYNFEKMLSLNKKIIKWIRHFTLFKVLLPDGISDPAGRGITFSKKAGI